MAGNGKRGGSSDTYEHKLKIFTYSLFPCFLGVGEPPWYDKDGKRYDQSGGVGQSQGESKWRVIIFMKFSFSSIKYIVYASKQYYYRSIRCEVS